MTGRDRGDWRVLLILDSDDSTKIKKIDRKSWQEFPAIGPERRKEETGAFALLVVGFLRNSGVKFVQGEKNTCFVRDLT